MENYISIWDINIKYIKGDLVSSNNNFYVCISNHISDFITCPYNEDYYWIKLNKISKKKVTSNENSKNKRKIEDSLIYEGKKQKVILNEKNNMECRINSLDIDSNLKQFLIEKNQSCINQPVNSESSKTTKWLSNVCSFPFNTYKHSIVNKNCSSKSIKNFLLKVKKTLDQDIHGLDIVKQEILEFVARKISNPDSKGHVLALYGPPGVAKTKIIKSLSKALDLPFNQINFGGISDSNILLGHSETYVGSKPGKIVECLINSECLNPIIYFDEIDKICSSKSDDIFGVLTHILDDEQNSKFQDNYFGNINIDLSKVLFVMSFNDISKIDNVVKDRMTLIHIDPPSLSDKIIIAKDKLFPTIVSEMNFDFNVVMDIETIEYIITHKTIDEKGVRQLNKNISKILNRLNYDILMSNKNIKKENIKDYVLTRSFINDVLPNTNSNYTDSFNMMYI